MGKFRLAAVLSMVVAAIVAWAPSPQAGQLPAAGPPPSPASAASRGQPPTASGQAQPPAGSGQAQPPAASGQAQPQPPGQQPPIFRAGVKLVRVDVSVTGRNDRPINDLKQEEFEVFEDGVPQRIETMQFLKLDGTAGPDNQNSLEIRSQEHAEAEAARDDVRVFVLFLDDYHIDRLPAITIPLRQGLTGFINRMQPTDLVAIVDPLTPISALRFTRAKDQLTDIIRKFEGRQGEIFPVKSGAEEAQLRSGDVDRLRAQVTLSALEALAIRLGGLKEGRKTIVFVSQGPRTYFASGTIEDDLRGVIQAANRANVTIHVLDPRGLAGPGFGQIDTLYRIANETGGRPIVRTNSFDQGLEEVVEDASAYYLLGYAPSRPEVDDGKFHKISVKVKRPGTQVLSRLGYWAPSRKELEAATAAANRPDIPGVTPAMRTLARIEPRGVVQSWVGLSKNEQGQTVATLTWEPMPGSQDRPVASVEVEVVASGAKIATAAPRVLPAPSPEKPGRPVDTFVVPPGEMLLRFVARAEDGTTIDRWEQPVTVPDLAGAPLALSTPRFHRTTSLVEVRALQAATANPVPTATRTFHQNERVFVDTEYYTAGGAGAPTLTAHLVSAEGKDIVELQVPPPSQGRVRFEVPVRGLGKGTYLVRIRAQLGEAQAEQLVAFKVTP